MKDQLEDIKKAFEGAIESITTQEMLEGLEKEFFGRKSGRLSLLMKDMKGMVVAERKEFGQGGSVWPPQ